MSWFHRWRYRRQGSESHVCWGACFQQHISPGDWSSQAITITWDKYKEGWVRHGGGRGTGQEGQEQIFYSEGLDKEDKEMQQRARSEIKIQTRKGRGGVERAWVHLDIHWLGLAGWTVVFISKPVGSQHCWVHGGHPINMYWLDPNSPTFMLNHWIEFAEFNR